jgi:hypothetical protein
MSAVLALRKQVAEQRCYTTDFSAGKNNINGLPRDMLVKIMMQADVRETVVFAQVRPLPGAPRCFRRMCMRITVIIASSSLPPLGLLAVAASCS